MSTPFFIFFLDNPNSTYHTTYQPRFQRGGTSFPLYPHKGGFVAMQWTGGRDSNSRGRSCSTIHNLSATTRSKPDWPAQQLLLLTWATGSEGQCDGSRMEQRTNQWSPSTRQNQKESHPEPEPVPSTMLPYIPKPGSTANASGSVFLCLQLVACFFNRPPGQQV